MILEPGFIDEYSFGFGATCLRKFSARFEIQILQPFLTVILTSGFPDLLAKHRSSLGGHREVPGILVGCEFGWMIG